jgi:anaerobic ribonucleoside-triphosphate reductase activating protein
VDDLFGQVAALGGNIEGVTITGGEPLEQCAGLLPLLQRIRRETPLSVLVFTGFTWEELQSRPAFLPGFRPEILSYVDLLLAGRFTTRPAASPGLSGLEHKTCHFLSSRYAAKDLTTVAPAEALIRPDGTILYSGLQPPRTAQGVGLAPRRD